jgi:predicted SAM-dependent methyltransferase
MNGAKYQNRLNYINIGCGDKFHESWVNIDINSVSPFVLKHNILEGLPFNDDTFEVVYHSQLLEHLPKDKAAKFLQECFRILKPGGIIRIVVPDLENIVCEYKKWLTENLKGSNSLSKANYNWCMLEMYDQTVRNKWGGEMAEYLKNPKISNEEYIVERVGFVGITMREQIKNQVQQTQIKKSSVIWKIARKIKKSLLKIDLRPKAIRQFFLKLILTKHEFTCLNIGKFRLGGEIHYWMYDRFSLKTILQENGYEQIEIMSAFTSSIPDWNLYELDIKKGKVYDPNSLFIEGKKPINKSV